MAALRRAKEKFEDAQQANRDQELRELGTELERRAHTNIPTLKKAQDELLAHVRESVLPDVNEARSRIERHTGLK